MLIVLIYCSTYDCEMWVKSGKTILSKQRRCSQKIHANRFLFIVYSTHLHSFIHSPLMTFQNICIFKY